jgi:hypothetical protein
MTKFQILQNYTTTVVPHDVWVQTSYHTAVGGVMSHPDLRANPNA